MKLNIIILSILSLCLDCRAEIPRVVDVDIFLRGGESPVASTKDIYSSHDVVLSLTNFMLRGKIISKLIKLSDVDGSNCDAIGDGVMAENAKIGILVRPMKAKVGTAKPSELISAPDGASDCSEGVKVFSSIRVSLLLGVVEIKNHKGIFWRQLSETDKEEIGKCVDQNFMPLYNLN